MSFSQPGGKRSISYYYDPEVGNFYYGQGHPMKPHRIRMAHNLLLNYGVLRRLNIFKPKKASAEQMTTFHSDQYVNFLKYATPDTNYDANERNKSSLHNVGEDSPIFDGIFEFCQISSGGSLAAATRLNRKEADIAINYSGGLHHAKKEFASGFCYINDIVLAILELLKFHEKVLYLDIDIHHGDGVEEAFYSTNRVMTVSFHKFGEFFPGTGDIRDIGVDKGRFYAVNVPLRDGITDEVYKTIFRPVVTRVIDIFKPDVIVLQTGADSLTGDRLGCFNLTVKGHGECVKFVKSLGLPLLVVGGGGYTIRNVARCWTYETALLADMEDISDIIPYNDYYEYFGPDFKLHIPPSNVNDLNTPDFLNSIREKVFENLRYVANEPTDNRETNFNNVYETDSDTSLDTGTKPKHRHAVMTTSSRQIYPEYNHDDKKGYSIMDVSKNHPNEKVSNSNSLQTNNSSDTAVRDDDSSDDEASVSHSESSLKSKTASVSGSSEKQSANY